MSCVTCRRKPPDVRRQCAERYWGDASDPLAALIARESARPHDDDPSPHGSLAGAYVHLLDRYGDMRALADYLLISISYCYRCYAKARLLAQSQHSVFCGATHSHDGVFAPKRWRSFRIQRATPQPTCDSHERARLPL
jgi:hypothetical protein